MVAYKIPSVGTEVELDRRCPHCGGWHGRIHTGVVDRGIQDWKVETVPQRRMRCPDCGLTWTLRVEGVGSGRQRTDRVISFAVVLYMCGLSYRGVEGVLVLLGIRVGKSSVERDVAAAGARRRRAQRLPVAGVDRHDGRAVRADPGRPAGAGQRPDAERAAQAHVQAWWSLGRQREAMAISLAIWRRPDTGPSGRCSPGHS